MYRPLAVIVGLLFSFAVLGQPAKDPPKPVVGGKEIKLRDGKTITLVNRQQMRLKSANAKRFTSPVIKTEIDQLPPIPTGTVDWTMADAVPLPPLGNTE